MEKPVDYSNVLAHGMNKDGETHRLVDHLESVARICGEFACDFKLKSVGELLGFWHDIGKIHPEFQKYLNESDKETRKGIRTVKKGPKHSPTGAARAKDLHPIAMVIASHHSGLQSKSDFARLFTEYFKRVEIKEAIDLWHKYENNRKDALIEKAKNELVSALKNESLTEFALRFMLSALVDADRLDTEKHYNPEKSLLRSDKPALEMMLDKLKMHHDHLDKSSVETKVNMVRREVLKACNLCAENELGIFRLTAPTGAGKTLSSMSFALHHAIKHNLRRIVVAIPYTSIIDQTADCYRKVFGDDCVLEHHSAMQEREKNLVTDEESYNSVNQRKDLATENWDAPLIVTTTNQLFESLFSNHPSRLRKIHNLACSVIIIDEVQTLPLKLLKPTIEAIRQIAEHYGSTIVLSTATQPALHENKQFEGLRNIKEIIPDAIELFDVLRRVGYQWPTGCMSWDEVAEEMRRHKQVLTVVNTKSDAIKLLQALDDETALHLSTSLCQAHRLEVINTVKDRLNNGDTLRLVSTQVIEAGVDLDFPVVMRAIGPMDRIVQAAGRCNREGKLETGRVIIFHPIEGKLPPGSYTTATQSTASLIQEGEIDANDPDLFERYFSRLYSEVNLDKYNIEEFRKHLNFPEIAKRYKFIKDETIPVVISGWKSEADRLIDRIRKKINAGEHLRREDFRSLQPYTVNIYRNQFERYRNCIDDSIPDILIWTGKYDRKFGLITEYTKTEDNLW